MTTKHGLTNQIAINTGYLAMNTVIDFRELERKACHIRKHLIEMFSYGKFHHYGGSLSCVEILTCLYFAKMNFSARLLNDAGRDRFIMSKGHSVPTQYVILSMLDVLDPSELKTIKTFGSRLQGHPDIRKTPGIEACTGSLGQGLSVANGLALAARLDGLKFNIFVVAGDGELQEGQIWEAAMTSSHYKLNNICLIVDCNQYQSQGAVQELMNVEPIVQRFEAFGWRALSIDGHSIPQICKALEHVDNVSDKPLVIVAKTVKGKGISFLQNTYKGHNIALTADQYHTALREIETQLNELEQ
jgi:transketolase